MRLRSGSPWLHLPPHRSARVRLVPRHFPVSFSAPGILNLPLQCRVLLTLTSRGTDGKWSSPPVALSTFKMVSAATSQTRAHSSHSHHHHDNTYLTSTNKSDAGVRITRIGLYVNLAMAIGKGIGGYVFHSQGKAVLYLHSYHSLNFMQHFPRMQSTASQISCPIS
jgi:hypothetical protein